MNPKTEAESKPLPWHWQREEVRFTIRRAYQKPPTCSQRKTNHKGSTNLSREGVARTIERLKGYALAAQAQGQTEQARKYLNGLRKFIAQVNGAMAAAGVGQLEPTLGEVPGVEP